MKIQLEWLKDYVDFDLPAEQIGHLLTMAGLEVESLERVELPGGKQTEVMELNVTPNRGYCLSYIGVAREVAAIMRKELRLPSPGTELEKLWGGASVEDRLAVENREEALCPRYSGMVIENVKPGPSPQWLADRLRAVGLRPINNIVDVTNYVMMEYGQPLHAFDRDLLSGSRVVVRRASAKEVFISLDGTSLELGEDALVIADAEKPVALAGIMGGKNSQVSEATRNLVLESACFDPVSVRKSSKKYGLRTDSSIRFERKVDIEGVIEAQSRAALLIQEIAGGEIRQGRIDRYPVPATPVRTRVRVSRVGKILGLELEPNVIRDYLERLGMKVEEEVSGAVFAVEIPGMRPTLSREIDLIEEIARLHDYANIPVVKPVASVRPVHSSVKRDRAGKIKETLSHLGYAEAIHYSFTGAEFADTFKTSFSENMGDCIALDNPLSSDMGTMRSNLISGLLQTAARNLAKGQKPVKIFEVGEVFSKSGDRFIQKTRMAVLAMGGYENTIWKESGKGYDFYDVKGIFETVMDQFKISPEYKPSEYSFMQSGKTVDCVVGGKRVGFLGALADAQVRALDLLPQCIVLEVELDALEVPLRARFQPIPKYPETYRDISIVIDQTVQSQTVADLIREVSVPLLRRVELYDQFDGKKIGEGKKSLTFALSFQSADKTLTDEEVNPVFDRVVKALDSRLGAVLRD